MDKYKKLKTYMETQRNKGRQSNLGNYILREVSELISGYVTEPQ